MFGAVIGKVLAPFMPYLLGGTIAVIAVLSGLLWWSSSKYDTLLSDSAAKIERSQANADQFEQTTKDQKATINKLLRKQAEDRVREKFRDKQLAQTQKSLDEERRTNEKNKRRWAKIANNKSELLSRIINRATNKRVHFFATATCRTGCNEDRSKDNGDKTPTETPTDTSD